MNIQQKSAGCRETFTEWKIFQNHRYRDLSQITIHCRERLSERLRPQPEDVLHDSDFIQNDNPEQFCLRLRKEDFANSSRARANKVPVYLVKKRKLVWLTPVSHFSYPNKFTFLKAGNPCSSQRQKGICRLDIKNNSLTFYRNTWFSEISTVVCSSYFKNLLSTDLNQQGMFKDLVSAEVSF